jgi:hypothetical protein
VGVAATMPLKFIDPHITTKITTSLRRLVHRMVDSLQFAKFGNSTNLV